MRYGHPQQTQIVGCVPVGVAKAKGFARAFW